MSDYLLFWMAKYALEALIAVAIITPILLLQLHSIYRQARCKHDGSIGETGACDAICRSCGKNLGFIGAWREKQRAADNEAGIAR